MKNHSDRIYKDIHDSIEVKKSILNEPLLLNTLEQVIWEIISAYRSDHKVLLCGNGGSAADAQHLAAELSGRYYLDRKPLYAEALHVNASHVTAVGNDYSFDEIYSRLVEAKGRSGDVLVAISTSGNSPNVIRAIEKANSISMITIGLTGASGGKMKSLCKYLLNVPSTDTPRIQEAHILMGHIICELVEAELFGQSD